MEEASEKLTFKSGVLFAVKTVLIFQECWKTGNSAGMLAWFKLC